jgi:hypothetical protein
LITSYWAVYSVTEGDLAEFMKNPGPKIRGAIGRAVPRELYRVFFKPERKLLTKGFTLNKLKHPPPPYIIPPPHMLSSSIVEIGLRIYGRVGMDTRLVSLIFRGLEKARFPGSLKLRLEEIYVSNELTNTRKILREGEKPITISIEDVEAWSREASTSNIESIKMVFLTPFKLLKNGKPISIEELRPSDIFRHIIRRAFLLEYLYNGRILAWMNPSYVQEFKEWADGNIILEKKLRESNVKVKGSGGFLEGVMIVKVGDRSRTYEVLKYSRIGEMIGIGKATSYGYGQYKMIIG